MAAAAGPSQITNHDITAVARLPGGPKLLARWAGTWLRGSVCHSTIRLWTGVRMVALDEGWAKPAPSEEPETRRKLRPIACAEPRLKIAETLVIEEEIKDILQEARAETAGVRHSRCSPIACAAHEDVGRRDRCKHNCVSTSRVDAKPSPPRRGKGPRRSLF